MGEGNVPLLAGKAQHQLAAMAAGQQLFDRQAQRIRQLGWPGASGLIEPVERGLHHIGQRDQPLAAHVQTKEQRCLVGRREMTERG